MADMEELNALSESVIGLVIQVHRLLGRLESGEHFVGAPTFCGGRPRKKDAVSG